MNGRRARERRRARLARAADARAKVPSTPQGKLDRAKADRDRALNELGREANAAQRALDERYAERREAIWADFKKRREAILGEKAA